ncbi:GH3 auxin-responsive promoter family protein [Psychroflexus sp. YR1-1]|uniref:GH3 auxin-responsive promoter family protein n=1 Tax=Psychroflexus aurantiacus TaxID=2709310 RepID=A0A6B3R629_9FLAO|nr:GH3 auxin-responsive promoter family protein [Psychroflexus aurantiacus]NEV93281.1 GH3 auxin-responsive promoter family protein [Psychroflexus aurantiacus]
MPIPIVNSIASWILKKRIHHMELFKKHPYEVQNELLLDLVYKAQNTEFGKTYGFHEIKSYEAFKDKLPVQTYEDLEATFERCRQGEANIIWPTPITMFAKSSGTTGAKSKFIPVSQESLEDCHYAASKDLLCIYLNNNPDSKLFTGKSLRLGGSKEIYQDKGTSYGDLSALLIYNMPFWASYSSTPGNSISLMSDWETKMQAIVDETIKERVTSLAGVPSWMLVLLNDVLKTTGKSSIDEVWPDLEVYFHGGVSFEPYKNQYENLIPSSNMKYYEIYNASEGFFAAQDSNDSKDLLLMLDYGIFFEFIPMSTYGTPNEKVISLSEVEIDKNYAIVITTNSGLWRYKIGDTIRFTSLSPHRIRVTGRTKHHINAFGEELIIENAEAAINKTASELQCEVMEYTAAPVFMSGNKKGAHEWILEFKTPPKSLSEFQIRLDQNLQEINSDYEAKRYNNMTLDLLKIHQAKPMLFQQWLKQHNKLGGQHKIPRLSNHREHLEELLALNRN